MENPMESTLASSGSDTLAPVRSDERIQALDVVRGFALIGIFLMNVEWFNRAMGEMSLGLPTGLTGANWWASRLIYVLVQGKFWTIFSLLFGMGFAVMLTRAEQGGRNFLRPYLRRIAALAVFGAAHHIFIWNGDILFSYAVGAVALLILLYGNWKYVAVALAALVGLGFLPKMEPLWGVAGSLAFVGAAALYLRGEKRVSLRGLSLPRWSFVVLILGTLAALGAVLLWLLPHGPKEPRIPLTLISAAVLTLGLLSARFHDPLDARFRRMGLTLYILPFVMMSAFGAVQYLVPPAPTAPQAQAAPPSAGKSSDKKPRKTEAEKRAEKEAERAKRIEKQREEILTETRVHAKGTYLEGVKLRAREFREHAPNEAGFAMVLIGMFLLGAWFVRSGIMANTRAHLPLFRKLAWMALPFGVGLGLVGSAIATTHVPGAERDGWQLANGLLMIGNLPACLGYVSVIVLLLNSDTVFAKVSILAPVGRMALTTYLTQSLLSALFFYGCGLGHWGMGRATQVVYVAVVFSLQVALSHWWLNRFRYGPMEWLWRAITYWKLPAMRLEKDETPDAMRAVEASVP